MGADILKKLESHTCSFAPGTVVHARTVRLLTEAAAEIGRLRREVEVESESARHWFKVATKHGATAQQTTLAPAEAKAPAPAMPNGVEGLVEALEMPDGYEVQEFLPGGWHYAWTRSDGERMVSGTTWNHPALAAIAAWQAVYDRAADNRDAAGVDRSGITPVFRVCTAYESGVGKGMQGRDLDNPYKPDTDEHEAWAHGFAEGRERSGDTPAAVPAGEAVEDDWQHESMRFLAYKLRQMRAVGFDAETCADAASWLEKLSRTPQAADGEAVAYIYQERYGHNDSAWVERINRSLPVWEHRNVVPLYAHPPPAPVQAAPQEGEAVGEVVAFGSADLKEVAWRKGKMPPTGTKLYANPSACELGAREAATVTTTSGPYGTVGEHRVALSPEFDAWLDQQPAGTVVALQHRGDSQEVGRG